MAKTVTVTTTVTLSGDGFGGSPFFNESLQNVSGNPPGSAILSTGFQSIAIPATAVGVAIVPPIGNTVTMTLKGVSGDTGLPIATGVSTRYMFPLGQSTFGITLGAGGPITVELIWL